MEHQESRRLIAALGAVLCLTACGTYDATSDLTAVQELGLAEQLRIGSVDDPETALTYVLALAVGSDGQIYSLHPQESLVRIHDATGLLVAQFGGRGEGPGEFTRPGVLGLLGDTLWVHDHGLYRLSYFGPDGELIETEKLDVDLGSRNNPYPPRPLGLLPDGNMLAQSLINSRDIASGEVVESSFLRWDRAGSLLDTIVVYPVANTVWEVHEGGDPPMWASYTSQPLADATIAQLSAYKSEVTIAERYAALSNDEAGFRITRRTFEGDTVYSTAFRYLPTRVSQGVIDSLVDMRAEQLSSGRLPDAPPKAKAATMARASLYTPSHYPPISMVLPGMDGSTWVRRELAGDSLVSWLRIEGDGAISGVVHAPVSLIPMVANRDTWWAVHYGDYGIPFIVRLAVSEP